jgi:hypothetical protein
MQSESGAIGDHKSHEVSHAALVQSGVSNSKNKKLSVNP